MKYISRFFFIVGLALGMTACNDSSEIIDPDGPQSGDLAVDINFELPQSSFQTRSKVSGTENRVHTMQMICFDANGLYLGIRNAEVTPDAGPTPDTGKIKGTVPQGTARIHFIANRNLTVPLSHTVGTQEEMVMKSEELSTIWNDANHQEICYWGYHKENTEALMQSWLTPTTVGTSKVYMIRDRAKVVLTYDPTDAQVPVTKIEWLIHNGKERGYLAPLKEYWENNDYWGNSVVNGVENQNVKVSKVTKINEYPTNNRYSLWTSETENDEDNFDVAYQSSGTYTPQPQFLFDDDNTDLDDIKVILRVTYTVNGSPKTVYHTLRLNDDDKVKYDIVRNNTYYIKCKLLSPDVAYYETLKKAIDGKEFVNAEMEVDRSIPDINDDTYTLQIKLPTETTSIVFNTEDSYTMDFVFRKNTDLSPGSTNPDDFEVKWEKLQSFCSNNLPVTYNSNTKQFTITATVLENQLTEDLQSEWIVVKHKATGLTRYIHVFVIDQFRYEMNPKLEKDGDDYKLSFQIPKPEDPDNPSTDDKIYPSSLYPIDVKFATNTLNAYGITKGATNQYGLFGVSVESTGDLFTASNFENNYNEPVSSQSTDDIEHWYYQQTENLWDFWYTYSIKNYDQTSDGVVNIYFKDVTDHIQYADVNEVGLFLYVKYFGKNYSVPLTTN